VEVEWNGTLRVQVEASASIAGYHAGGRFVRMRGARLQNVPHPFWAPDEEDRPLVADPAEEAALTDADHEARA